MKEKSRFCLRNGKKAPKGAFIKGN